MTDSMVRLRSDLAQRSFAQWMYGYVGVALVLLHTVDELSTLFGMSGLLQPAATLLGSPLPLMGALARRERFRRRLWPWQQITQATQWAQTHPATGARLRRLADMARHENTTLL